MTLLPYIPETAPFSSEQRAWLNGFFAGLYSRSPGASPGAAAGLQDAPKTLAPLTILFGSQTGTAEGLAKRAAKEAGKRGFAATVLDMAQTDPAKLATEKNLFVITSTHGDGEPPDNARALHAGLSSPIPAGAAKPLANVRYAVCALGDTNYTQFCKCGRDFDALLEIRGARRISPRADCDVEYEGSFTAWLDAALTALTDAPQGAPQPGAAPRDATPVSGISDTGSAAGFTRSQPFPAPLIASRNLNGPGSAKQVHHVEFDLAGSGLEYYPGDALGVYPHNCPELVADVVEALGCDGEEAVPAPDGSTTSLRHALTEHCDLGKPTAGLLAQFGGGGGGTAVSLHQVIDVLLARADVTLSPPDFVRCLKRLQPRLYSISSSPHAHPGQVHLTVGALRYDAGDRPRKGVCSTFLADRAVPGKSRIGVFVHTNKGFRLPANNDAPVIMVGPGTGIAPFRSFLHERRSLAAKGRNWLFFGDQRAASDFLYRDELVAFQQDGILTRLDLAWSRDHREKIYVQSRMLEQAGELYSWLEAGAHFYVCGDANRMARDVDAALHSVVQIAGGRTADQAAEYVRSLIASKRYCRDVY